MRSDYLDWMASSVVTAILCNIIVFLNKLSVMRISCPSFLSIVYREVDPNESVLSIFGDNSSWLLSVKYVMRDQL